MAQRWIGVYDMAAGRYEVVDLEISTSRAVLPMRLRRQAKTFCVTLPEP